MIAKSGSSSSLTGTLCCSTGDEAGAHGLSPSKQHAEYSTVNYIRYLLTVCRCHLPSLPSLIPSPFPFCFHIPYSTTPPCFSTDFRIPKLSAPFPNLLADYLLAFLQLVCISILWLIMNRVPEVSRGRAKRRTIKNIQKLLSKYGAEDWKDGFDQAAALNELNHSSNFNLGWTNPRKGDSVLVKFSNNSESSQKVWMRLSHALLGPAMQEARTAFFEISRLRNSVGLVYEVINKPEFFALSARAKVVCLFATNMRHEHMSRSCGSNRWTDMEAKAFINHVAALVVNVEQFFKDRVPTRSWQELFFWKAGTNKVGKFGVDGGIIGAISHVCTRRWFSTDEERSEEQSFLPYNFAVAVVTDMEKIRGTLVAAVKRITCSGTSGMDRSSGEESGTNSPVEDNVMVQEVH